LGGNDIIKKPKPIGHKKNRGLINVKKKKLKKKKTSITKCQINDSQREEKDSGDQHKNGGKKQLQISREKADIQPVPPQKLHNRSIMDPKRPRATKKVGGTQKKKGD